MDDGGKLMHRNLPALLPPPNFNEKDREVSVVAVDCAYNHVFSGPSVVVASYTSNALLRTSLHT